MVHRINQVAKAGNRDVSSRESATWRWIRRNLILPATFRSQCQEANGAGTIPPRLETSLLVVYLLINIVFCLPGYNLFMGNQLYVAQLFTIAANVIPVMPQKSYSWLVTWQIAQVSSRSHSYPWCGCSQPATIPFYGSRAGLLQLTIGSIAGSLEFPPCMLSCTVSLTPCSLSTSALLPPTTTLSRGRHSTGTREKL